MENKLRNIQWSAMDLDNSINIHLDPKGEDRTTDIVGSIKHINDMVEQLKKEKGEDWLTYVPPCTNFDPKNATYIQVWIEEDEKWYFYVNNFNMAKFYKTGFVDYYIKVVEGKIVEDTMRPSNVGKMFGVEYDLAYWSDSLLNQDFIAARNYPFDANSNDERDIKVGESMEIVKIDLEKNEYTVLNKSLGAKNAWFIVNEKDLSELLGCI